MTITPSSHSWVTCCKPNPKAHLRLLCFPCAGGGASAFNSWSERLPPRLAAEVEVCAVQLPGRENRLREPPFTQLSLIVGTLAQALRPYADKPFALLGHSMGGLIGFELARQYRKQHMPGPVHLCIAGYRAPQLPDPEPPLHQLPQSELVAELRRRYGTPDNVLKNSELMELLLPLLRADFAVCETYRYSTEKPLDCPISVFGGLEDNKVNREELAAWRLQTSSRFTLRVLRGDHFFLQSAPNLILRFLSQDLEPFLRSARSGAVRPVR